MAAGKDELRALKRRDLKHRKFETAYARYIAVRDFLTDLEDFPNGGGPSWTVLTLRERAEKLRPKLAGE